jgi:hypothetical protein
LVSQAGWLSLEAAEVISLNITVAYVICQVPITKMPKYDRKELEYLQKRCHDLSKRIQEHVRKDKAKRGQTTPTLTMLAILIA